MNRANGEPCADDSCKACLEGVCRLKDIRQVTTQAQSEGSPPQPDLLEVEQAKAVDFSADVEQALCNTRQYEWHFGDGASSREEAPSHTYATIGSYPVRVQVRCDKTCDQESDDMTAQVVELQLAVNRVVPQ